LLAISRSLLRIAIEIGQLAKCDFKISKAKLYYNNYSLSFIDFNILYTSDQSLKLYHFAKELDLDLNL